jgi:hypothetical protein
MAWIAFCIPEKGTAAHAIRDNEMHEPADS